MKERALNGGRKSKKCISDGSPGKGAKERPSLLNGCSERIRAKAYTNGICERTKKYVSNRGRKGRQSRKKRMFNGSRERSQLKKCSFDRSHIRSRRYKIACPTGVVK